MFIRGTARHVLQEEMPHCFEFIADTPQSQQMNPHIILCRLCTKTTFLAGGEFDRLSTMNKRQTVLNITFHLSRMKRTFKPSEFNSSTVVEAMKIHTVIPR